MKNVGSTLLTEQFVTVNPTFLSIFKKYQITLGKNYDSRIGLINCLKTGLGTAGKMSDHPCCQINRRER